MHFMHGAVYYKLKNSAKRKMVALLYSDTLQSINIKSINIRSFGTIMNTLEIYLFKIFWHFNSKWSIKLNQWQTVVWLPQILEQRYEILFLWSWYNFSQDVYQKILTNICLPFNHCFFPEKKSQNPDNSYKACYNGKYNQLR